MTPLVATENELSTNCSAETSLCSPETGGIDSHSVGVQPQNEPEQPQLPNEESAVVSGDSTLNTAGHSETANLDIALHEDPPYTVVEDQVGSQPANSPTATT